MKQDSADLHPEHARRILIIAVTLWSIAHIIAIIKFLVAKEYITLFILILPVAFNVWAIIRIINFYKPKP